MPSGCGNPDGGGGKDEGYFALFLLDDHRLAASAVIGTGLLLEQAGEKSLLGARVARIARRGADRFTLDGLALNRFALDGLLALRRFALGGFALRLAALLLEAEPFEETRLVAGIARIALGLFLFRLLALGLLALGFVAAAFLLEEAERALLGAGIGARIASGGAVDRLALDGGTLDRFTFHRGALDGRARGRGAFRSTGIATVVAFSHSQAGEESGLGTTVTRVGRGRTGIATASLGLGQDQATGYRRHGGNFGKVEH